jgi:hypothetical protein
MIPDLALSFARANGWHFAVGLSGSVGINYDFPADPAAGVDHLFFAECSIAGLPLAVAKQVNDRCGSAPSSYRCSATCAIASTWETLRSPSS